MCVSVCLWTQYLIPTSVNPGLGAAISSFHSLPFVKVLLLSVLVNSPWASTMSDGGPRATLTQWSPKD